MFELGCGTGRLAALLLDGPPAGDRESTAASTSARRWSAWPASAWRASAPAPRWHWRPAQPPRDEPTADYDRFLSTYVLDLLSEDDIAAVLVEAHRMLVPGGLLCLTSLSTGDGPGSRLMARFWSAVHRWRPALVGGCRPLDLLPRRRSGGVVGASRRAAGAVRASPPKPSSPSAD